MLGWVTMGEGKKANLERTEILGLPLLKLELPAPGRRWERRADKGLCLLAQERVTRVLAPAEFPHWPLLVTYGFRGVDTCPLRCALVPRWTLESLRVQGLEPRRSVLRLEGERVSPELSLVARQLCPQVHNLVINAAGGEALSAELRREFGLSVLPGRWAADLTLRVENGPVLTRANYGLRGGIVPADCDALPLLCALWQCGRLNLEDITLQIASNCM